MNPLAFERLDWEGGRPVVRVRYRDHRGELCSMGFPIEALEELLAIAYDALGRPPGGPRGGIRTKGARGVRTPPSTRTASAEARARQAWRPGMSVAELTRAAGIGRSAASKWCTVLRGEEREEVAL